MQSKEHKAKVAVGKTKKTGPKVLGRIGGADLTSKPDSKLVSKERFGKVRNAGHKTTFTSQAVPLSHEKASKLGDAVGNYRKPEVTQWKGRGGRRPTSPKAK